MSSDNAGFPSGLSLNLLAFDTSTEILRAAVARGTHVVAHEGPGGAQASATLLPAIQALLREAGLALRELDAIAFGRGPGSFTGLRTACAVAQGLGFGSGVPLLPVDTLLTVAQDARERTGAADVVAVLDARMDEVYVQHWRLQGATWQADAPARLSAPEDVSVPAGAVLAGNAFEAYPGRFAVASAVAAAPTAHALLALAPQALAAGAAVRAAAAMPLYIRDKVAQTTEERALARAARP